MNELQPITHLPDELREQRRKTRETTRQIYRGTSAKTNCDSCGFPTERLECHHHDYNCPEKVSFLCRICHNEYHENSGVTISYANEFKNRAEWLRKNKEISNEYAKYIKEMIVCLEKTTYAERLRPLPFTRNHSMEQRFLSPRWNEEKRRGGRPKQNQEVGK